MTEDRAYDSDLAYIHDQGYGGFARGSAPGLMNHFRQMGFNDGQVVDLGCGSGIWARELVDAGYQVVGVDISAAMIEIARQRVPEAEFHVGSFLRFPIPPCRAVTAIGEVFNYLFDTDNSVRSLETVCKHAFDALSPGGLLIFDVAEPGRCRGRTQAFTEGENWTCLVEYKHDDSNQQLTRRIVTFRKVGDNFRRSEEFHRQQLFEEGVITSMLESVGFQVKIVRGYGEQPLGECVIGFIAKRPSP
ncbi:MAG: class I SAM-dependent methyltransferase [Pirellulales bacterium]